jgi:hypothetical protein
MLSPYAGVIFNLAMLGEMVLANQYNCQRLCMLGQDVLVVLDNAGNHTRAVRTVRAVVSLAMKKQSNDNGSGSGSSGTSSATVQSARRCDVAAAAGAAAASLPWQLQVDSTALQCSEEQQQLLQQQQQQEQLLSRHAMLA